MNAEQIIKDALDGYFFTLDVGRGKTVAKKVSRDHIPAHAPQHPICLEAPGRGAKVWRPEEDELLFEMFQSGYSFLEMAEVLKISQSLANNRFRHLCIKRGISPTRQSVQAKFTEEIEALVMKRKAAGLSFRQISKELHLTVNQVAGLVRRHREKAGLVERAA